MIIGENRKFPAALIVPNLDAVKNWAERHNLDKNDPDIINNPEVRNKFQSEIELTNQSFGHWEQVKKFEVLNDQWGIASGELTPTLKLKRRVIKEKYTNLIEKIYAV